MLLDTIERCRNANRTDYVSPENRRADLRLNAVEKINAAISAVVAFHGEHAGGMDSDDLCHIVNECLASSTWKMADYAVAPKDELTDAEKERNLLAKVLTELCDLAAQPDGADKAYDRLVSIRRYGEFNKDLVRAMAYASEES